MSIFKSTITAKGHVLGPFVINRVMPQQGLTPVGAFVFLDHFDLQLSPEQVPKPDGSLAHPHRGIATLTYLMNGEVTHLDSYSHQGTVQAGGVQWMNAGNGIVHDEWAKPVGNVLRGLQFWMNLSSQGKAKAPEYRAISDKELPRLTIGASDGYIKVIVGDYKGVSSNIPVENRQILIHIHLKKGDDVNVDLNANDQYAIYLANGSISVSGLILEPTEQGYLVEKLSIAHIVAKKDSDVFFYGGEAYKETIVCDGPFMMNNRQGIAIAHQDYLSGKYGKIDYKLLGYK